MRCPFCGEPETKVIDSRLSSETNAIKRRRECISCQKRFNTTEHSELSYPRVIKSDKSSELFSEDMKKNAELDIQEITNNFISKIDQVFEIKQKEIMTV